MKEKLKHLYDEYIGWLVLIIIIFPLGIVLNKKFLETIGKLYEKYDKF